ncbi:DUF1844 domain-containing protein [Neorhodopirellula pilleata]|uniref:DUF1844 domain-containing protein n=1 Tax=Neorhodopirellula pilleata TaxID=2714738 RepID=A0A5C6AAV1_9BACT|nr:DUF1844 domain-containing protein [Neorhodopirellula pilleata]TWT95453.1 hypothetical protein Pla100_30940 [Neorhodopirellula pilleata]
MNDPNETPSEPKIIVDSDWKEQVAQEKEKLKNESEGRTPDAASPPAQTDDAISDSPLPAAASSEAPRSQPALPPASFEVLVSMLFTQAISALGQIPGPSGETPSIDKPMAKHTIDTLEMLQEKTKGNLTNEETKMVGEALHALRMTYVSVRG